MSFYQMTKNACDTGGVLYIDGEIVTEEWFGDGSEVVARKFRQELDKLGDVTVYINSPGGDVFAGAEIYTMLREHTGTVTVKISSIAASIASLIAMAGDEVLISPVGSIMIHNPWTFAAGNAKEMEYWAGVLREIGEGIVTAYAEKTGKTRDEINQLLDGETYMNAQTAIADGFADGLMEFTDMEAAVPPKKQKARAMMQMGNYGPAAICAAMGKPSHPTTFMGRALPAVSIPPAPTLAGGQPEDDPDCAERQEIAQRAEVLALCYPV